MPSFGRPDAKGRSSGHRSGRDGKVHRPPRGEPFVWLTRELLSSPSWRARSINTVRLLDFLMIEHMNHAGTLNGRLMATHEQLRDFGLSANAIRPSIEEAEFLGLLRYTRGGRWAGSNQPSVFRLTFLPADNKSPTNEWKQRTKEEIRTWEHERSRRRVAVQKRKAALRYESAVPFKVRA
ncbi:hypothetical protein [Minwuia sp. IMCC3077]|uniref:hypothetical protein n=1 Tax=Minwuia sp. IMCC3077 TaxID=3040676 RepID=UPI002478D7FE|nr:hypothetical protein [Minwuia sp. IMCC3077]